MTDNEIEGKIFNKFIHIQSCFGIGYESNVKECGKCELRDKCQLKTEKFKESMTFKRANEFGPLTEQLMEEAKKII